MKKGVALNEQKKQLAALMCQTKEDLMKIIQDPKQPMYLKNAASSLYNGDNQTVIQTINLYPDV